MITRSRRARLPRLLHGLRARLAEPVLESCAARRSRVSASARPSPSGNPSRCATNASNAVPAREVNPVACAATSTFLIASLTLKVNLLSGWINDSQTAILPAQADISSLSAPSTGPRYRRIEARSAPMGCYVKH